MIINALFTKQSLLPQFSPLMCVLSLWWYNQSKRGKKWGSAEKEEFRGWFFSWEQSAHPKGDPALLWNSLNLPVDQAPNSSIYISVMYPLSAIRGAAAVPGYTLGLLAVLISSSWHFIKQVKAEYIPVRVASVFIKKHLNSRFTWRHKYEKC